MREIELKAALDDPDACRRRVESAGARLVFRGRLEDRRYDTPGRKLGRRDEVLRVRVYRDDHGARAELTWKGPASYPGGYKVREELGTPAGDPGALATILERLGFVVTKAIDRTIAQYELEGVVLRFEHYPRMDVLLEIEGSERAIERAIAVTGVPRNRFTADRLRAFVDRFQRRTGERAALCDVELSGDYPYAPDDD